MRIDLQPGEVCRRHSVGNTLESFGLEIEIDIQMNSHVRTDSTSNGHELFGHAPREPVVPVQFRPSRRAAETRDIRRQGATYRGHDIGFQSAKAELFYLLGVPRKVIVV